MRGFIYRPPLMYNPLRWINFTMECAYAFKVKWTHKTDEDSVEN